MFPGTRFRYFPWHVWFKNSIYHQIDYWLYLTLLPMRVKTHEGIFCLDFAVAHVYICLLIAFFNEFLQLFIRKCDVVPFASKTLLALRQGTFPCLCMHQIKLLALALYWRYSHEYISFVSLIVDSCYLSRIFLLRSLVHGWILIFIGCILVPGTHWNLEYHPWIEALYNR